MTKLSDAAIKKLEAPEKGQRIIYDRHPDSPKGFGVRLTPAGTVAFILRYQRFGKDRRMTIGGYPDWSLAAARKQAQAYKREIDSGVDILQERRMKREAPTVAEAVERYCVEHFDKLVSGKAARSRMERFLVARMGAYKLFEVRRPDLRALVREVAAKTPREAALLLTNIKTFFAWAEDEELVESNPVATLKPAKVSPALKPRARTRVLDDDEIRAFWESVETVGMHRLTALALKLVLVTGQRPGEVAGMRWSEIQNGVWTIPANRRGKTSTEHRVPITQTAQAVLDGAREEVERLSKRRSSKPSDIVFETQPGKALRTDAISKAVARHIDDMGAKDSQDWGTWTAHDLRRTMRTGLAAAGVPVLVAEIGIGHVKKGIIGTYDAHHYADEIRTALETWDRRLRRIIREGVDEHQVVAFQKGRRA